MLNLKIHHNVYLTRKQRYALHEGEDQIVVGVSVPVWDRNKNTTEPAKEVFCLYHLKNTKEDAPIRITASGYEITLPYRESKIPSLDNETWRDWSLNHPKKLTEYYKSCSPEVSSKNLLDISDGGSRTLSYREHNKMKKGDELWNITHFVNIADMQRLEDSLCTV